MKISVDATTTTLEIAPEIQRDINTADFLAALTARPRIGFLPPGVRWISEGANAILIEQKPHLQKVRYMPQHDDLGSQDYDIPVPWTLMGLAFTPNLETLLSARMYYNTRPVNGFDDDMSVPCIPNVYSNNTLCLGQEFADAYAAHWAAAMVAGTPLTLIDAAMFVVNYFWSTGLNQEVLNWLDSWRLPKWLPENLLVGPSYSEDGEDDSEERALYRNDERSMLILHRYQNLSLEQFLAYGPWGTANSLNPPEADTVDALIRTLTNEAGTVDFDAEQAFVYFIQKINSLQS